jgi:hypothetical protein
MGSPKSGGCICGIVSEGSRASGEAPGWGYLLVGADNRVAPKVVPPTLHVRIQIRLDESVCPQLEKGAVSTAVATRPDHRRELAHPNALDIIILLLKFAPSHRGQPQG